MDAAPLSARWVRTLVIASSVILVVAALYLARVILIPVVLAVLLTFILSPFVLALQKLHIGRVPAVLLVTLCALLLLGGLGVAVLEQIKNLAAEVPDRKEDIAKKIVSLREASKGSWLDKVWEAIQDIGEEIKSAEQKTGTGNAVAPVQVVSVDSFPMEILRYVADPAIEVLAGATLIVVLVIFMLIKREDLRNRLIRFSGEASLTSMTKALDDAAQRISRFLLVQLVINSCFGLLVAAGLALIGVPYALVWGFLAGALRYIPYIGGWLAAVLPLTLSVAVFPGWTEAILVLVLFVVLELLAATWAEPLLFGHSVGVSEVALLVAVAFWGWLWGPIGMLLSAPLTALLVVLGRHVPHLEFFNILLGDQPPLAPHVIYYQRLLARDEDEATQLVEDYAREHPVAKVYDELLVPALVLAADNSGHGRMTEEDEQYIVHVTREVIDDLASADDAKGWANGGESQVLILGCPAREESEELVLHMLREMLNDRKNLMAVAHAETLSAEVLQRIEQEKPAVVCIASLPSKGLTHTRYLCKRLHGRIPQVKIVILFPGREAQLEWARKRLQEAGADHIAASLEECRAQLAPLLQVLTSQPDGSRVLASAK